MTLQPWMKYGVAGLGGLIIGAAASSGDTKTKTTTQVADAETVTVTRTVSRTRTVRANPTPRPVPTQAASTSSAAIKSFSGNGGRKLAPFTIDSPAMLKWTNDGEIFQVFDIENGVTINADSHSGENYLEPGTYTLDVNALGNWTIKIVPE